MPDAETASVLRRKLRAPAGPFDAPGVTLAKSMRLALVRAVEEETGLEVIVTGFSEVKITLAEMADQCGEHDLIFMTEGPAGGIGLAVLDMAAVSALLEQLITGRVAPGDSPARRPTATDAAVIGDILGAIMTQSDDGLDQVAKPPPIAGFRTTGILEDGRAVSLALEDLAYRSLQITLDMGQGSKTGHLRLIYPWARMGGVDSEGQNAGTWGQGWHKAIEASQVTVEAVLLRLPMSIGDVAKLKVGECLPIPGECIGNVSIEGMDHRRVATGRLGQSNGLRAVRLNNLNPDIQLVQPSTGNYGRPIDRGTELAPDTAEIEASALPVNGTSEPA